MKRTSFFAVLLAASVVLVAVAGCGGGAGTSASSVPEKPATTPTGKSMSTIIADYSRLSAEETGAALEALRCAEDMNCGSTFKAASVRCQEGWARVSVLEIDVPADEGVGFDVYLKKRGGGRWEVMQTGNDLTAEDLPAAPPEIFDR